MRSTYVRTSSRVNTPCTTTTSPDSTFHVVTSGKYDEPRSIWCRERCAMRVSGPSRGRYPAARCSVRVTPSTPQNGTIHEPYGTFIQRIDSPNAIESIRYSIDADLPTASLAPRRDGSSLWGHSSSLQRRCGCRSRRAPPQVGRPCRPSDTWHTLLGTHALDILAYGTLVASARALSPHNEMLQFPAVR